jgi:ABC-type multidrug transport system fused ATPase/permease subunit
MALCGITLLAPDLGLSFPKLVAFLVAIRQCGASIAMVSSQLVDLQSFRPRVGVIEEIRDKMPGERSGTAKLPTVSNLTLRDLSFRYVSRGDVLKNVNITLTKGTVTAVVGSTGSGKSTIANLIVRLYPPASGSILVEDMDLKTVSLEEWRSRIGYVPQDPFLFNTSIHNNIALWDTAITPAEIQSASRLAQLHDFVAKLPMGYDTIVGDHGLELSGGQAQRVAIARAILRKPEILIFDEATSALDNLTERAVYEAISAMRSNAIVLVIAHRLSTVRDADRIVVLDGGAVVESGTHESLMRDSGPYSRLYKTEVHRN